MEIGMRTYLLWFVTLFVCTTGATGFLMKDNGYVRQPDLDDSDHSDLTVRRYVPDRERGILVRILRELHRFTDVNSHLVNIDASYNNDNARPDINVGKRDYGIMPPWHELCRMMKITNCRRGHS